jgi:hypothetical protein
LNIVESLQPPSFVKLYLIFFVPKPATLGVNTLFVIPFPENAPPVGVADNEIGAVLAKIILEKLEEFAVCLEQPTYNFSIS